MVMPGWKGQVAVQERDGASGLWNDEVCPGASSIGVALQAIRTILVDSTAPPEMTCAARSCNVEFWRADFGNDTRMEGAQATLRKFGTFRGMGAGWSRDHFPVTKWAHLTERTIHHISANHN